MVELSIDLECSPLSMCLVRNIKNIEVFREQVLKGDLACCLVKPSLVVDPFQVVVAANKAALASKYGYLTTRSVFSETLFNLSLTKNISKSLKTFGVGPQDKDLLIIVFGDSEELKRILSHVDGDQESLDSLIKFCDKKEIIKLYNITDNELKLFSLVDCIVTRIATKPC